MSEIKYAIEILKKCSLEYASSLEEVKAIHLAVDVLIEKLEREQGCEHCTPTLAFGLIFDIKRTPNEPVSMNYCPFCGRSLQNE